MRKTILLVLLALLAMAPFAQAQQPRGYYDQYGRWHEPTTQNDGYYDQYGRWHPNTERGGYYDQYGQWHPDATQGTESGGYYDRNGQWHAYGNTYGNDRYGRVAGPERWTYNEKGRAETLPTASRNFASTVASVQREAYRHSAASDRIALEALRRLDEQAQYFARVTQQRNRPELVGDAYANLVAAFGEVHRRFGALDPDGWLANRFEVMAAAIGRLDKRYFGNRAFGGQNPRRLGYGFEGSRDDGYGYDRYGNPLPRDPYDRSGRDTRPPRPYPN